MQAKRHNTGCLRHMMHEYTMHATTAHVIIASAIFSSRHRAPGSQSAQPSSKAQLHMQQQASPHKGQAGRARQAAAPGRAHEACRRLWGSAREFPRRSQVTYSSSSFVSSCIRCTVSCVTLLGEVERCGLVRSGLVWSGLVRSGLVRSGLVWSGLA